MTRRDRIRRIEAKRPRAPVVTFTRSTTRDTTAEAVDYVASLLDERADRKEG